ncbi:prolyl oligopeptidase family serine peptidase [Sphingomonas sp. QA11]|uniref:prolyl oligopeptidase family serine peptidase n=1 Tax=Sphingomonas sp. QA11 TaxID=2950605 RepID=UPI00234A40AA|nr:prolyl oligopeptidase family serine peptidase [Sphingomonas sp. QA11]WCM25930.1 prolyl oligopeptidase family serine peptidase [Sphingomonas sp. QA11]
MHSRRALAAALLCVGQWGSCAGLQDHQADPALPTVSDLIEVRTLGDLALSPDEQQVAYRLIEPSIADDRITAQWYRVPLSGGTPMALGRPSSPDFVPLYDLVEDSAALWAADSRSILARQTFGGAVQIHQLGLDGADRQITDDSADVAAFDIDPISGDLTYAVRNSREQIARDQREEETKGIRIDQSVSTEGLRLSRNYQIGDRWTTIRWVKPGFAGEAFAGPEREERAHPSQHVARSAPSPFLLDTSIAADLTRSLPFHRNGISVSLRMLRPAGRFFAGDIMQIVAHLPDGSVTKCDLAICQGNQGSLKAVAVAPDRGDVLIIREDDYAARSKIYAWNPLNGKSRLVLDPRGSLDGGASYTGRSCLGSARGLICAFSAATIAPRLVLISTRTGKMTTLVKPNRDFAYRAVSTVDYLAWRDKSGQRSTGVLALPKRRKGPVPLVITTYRCRGLLRGSQSTLAPEYPLVAGGFAALCVNNNNANALAPEVEHGTEPLLAHRATLESYRAIIEQLAARKIIDPTRVGIAGHSYSANVVAYGVSHSDLFAAAVIGGGITIDPLTYVLSQPTVPSWRSTVLDFLALPAPDRDPHGQWSKYAPSASAGTIRAPLLIESPESEYLDSLQLFAAVQHAGGTSDMFVFPSQAHMAGRSPAQQYWRALRAVDWFRFWLGGDRDNALGLHDDLTHWDTLRRARDQAAGSATG